MARVPLSDEAVRFIADRIASFPTDPPDRLWWQAGYVTNFGALPLYLGWTETIGITPDGRVIRWSTEGEYAGARPVEDRDWVLLTLVDGAARYPGLRSLLPERGAEAIDCAC